MNIKGSYVKPLRRGLADLMGLFQNPETLADFFLRPNEYPAKLGPVREIGVQPQVRFGTSPEEVEVRGENLQTALLLELYRVVVRRFSRLSEKEAKLIPTFSEISAGEEITSVREALKEAWRLERISVAVSAAMIAETFEMNLVSAILGEAGMDTDLMNAEFIDKGWNPYLWQGSFMGTARYFLDHQMEAEKLLPLGPLVDFTGLIPVEGEKFKRWARMIEASLLHKPSDHPDVKHVDWIWQHPAYVTAQEKLSREEREGLLTRIASQLEYEATERNRSRARALQAGQERPEVNPGSSLAAMISQLDTRLSVNEEHQKREAAFFKQWQQTAKLFPYLRPLMSEFTLNLDRAAAMRLNVQRAAIDPNERVLYLNKGNIDVNEWSGDLSYLYPLMMLKMALGHHERMNGKDAFLWDVASEILLTGWLSGLNVSIPDWVQRFPDLEGLPSVEAIYLRLLEWPKKDLRRLLSVRGPLSSILTQGELTAAEQADRDAALLGRVREGVELAQALEGASWGDHGAGLERALRARAARAIPWKPAFAEYLTELTPTPERERSYTKLSRRIRHREEPRAGRRRIRQDDSHNLLIIVDPSGSMSDEDLQDALGVIRSTAAALSINAIRVFACDAQVRDYGWSAPWHAGGQVTLHGGGGTNLDPALRLIASLTEDGDLLPEQPLLIITDGLFAGEIRTEREHAYLLPKGAALGYRTTARIFHVQREE